MISQVGDFLTNWKTIAGGIVILFGLVGADGRQTAQKLDTHIVTQATRDSVQDEGLLEVRRLILAYCIQETHPIARQSLRCGDREREAGIPNVR